MNLDTRSSYDRLAMEYANRIYAELQHKPFDCKMLDWLIEKVDGVGSLCDIGSGPGQIARYLRDHGAEVSGVDLSPEMVNTAQKLNPDISFQTGDMRALSQIPDNTFGGIAAFYCILHVPHGEVMGALQELKRILRPNGVLLLTFHIGSEIRHVEELWGEAVTLDFIFFEREEMKGYLQSAGFQLVEVIERDPYPEVEVQTRRAYIFAAKV